MKSFTAVVAGLIFSASAIAADLYNTESANIHPIRTANYEIHRVPGQDIFIITNYRVENGTVAVSTRVVNAADATGARDAHVDSNVVSGPHTMGLPVGCGQGCTLIDQYSHSTPLGGCNTAVTTTFVYMDDNGDVFTSNQTNIIRTPSCRPGN